MVFLPLGGVGEIGMNLYLYGYGRDGAPRMADRRHGRHLRQRVRAGVDVILPDIRFLEEERHNIVGIVLTPCA